MSAAATGTATLSYAANPASTGFMSLLGAAGRTVNLARDYINTGAQYISIVNMSFNTNNYNMSVQAVTGGGSIARTINLGTSTITISSNGTYSWNLSGSNLTLNALNSTIVFTENYYTRALPNYFNGNGQTYGTILIAPAGTTSFGQVFVVRDNNNTITNLNYQVNPSGITFNQLGFTSVSTLNLTVVNWGAGATGNSTFPMFITPFGASINAHQLILGSIPLTVDYLTITDVYSNSLTPLQTYFSGSNIKFNSSSSVAVYNNAFATYGYSRSTQTTNQKIYVLTTGTTWTAPSDFNTAENTVWIIGAGGGASGASINATTGDKVGGCGGGGGGCTKLTNASIVAGTTYTISIGARGNAANGNITSSVSTGGTGGNTSITIGSTTYTANGGTGGVSNVTGTVRTAGTGGTGSTGNGGNGGIGGVVGTGLGVGGGGGGGSAGDQGNGAAGGNAFSGSGSGGGGGGSSGGSAGASGTGTASVNGGNNYLGIGGGIDGTSNAFNGGGGASTGLNSGQRNGAPSTDCAGLGGSGGGGGANRQDTATTAGIRGGYSARFGGGGGGGSTSDSVAAGAAAAGGNGGAGVIIISYISISPSNTGNFFFFM
jgi:hypothetical protein